jgi:hypothetical protein
MARRKPVQRETLHMMVETLHAITKQFLAIENGGATVEPPPPTVQRKAMGAERTLTIAAAQERRSA